MEDEDVISSEDEQAAIAEMEEWFRARYEDPAQRTPYESAEGGYIWIWGGPYDAREVLENQFGGEYPSSVIERLADDLSGESPEWAPIPREEDYDHSLLSRVSENRAALTTFNEGAAIVEDLLDQDLDPGLHEALLRLLFANVITALETYLSDTFLNAVFRNEAVMQKFVETTPEFKERKVPLSEVLKAAQNLKDEVRRYLLDVVWHNLARANALYRDTLDIEFGPAIRDIGPAIPKRHDIVHRNGKKKDGTPVIVSRSDVEKLIVDVRALVYAVDAQVKALELTYELADEEFVDF